MEKDEYIHHLQLGLFYGSFGGLNWKNFQSVSDRACWKINMKLIV